jgi:hypothetical protein
MQNSIIFLIYHTVQKPLLLACHSGNQTNNIGRCHPSQIYCLWSIQKKLKNQCSVESTMPITTKNYHFQKLKTTREPTSWGQGPLTRGLRICRLSFIVPRRLMTSCLREASEDLSNHQVEAIELELDCVLSVFPGL